MNIYSESRCIMKRIDVAELTQSAIAQAMGSTYMEKLGNIADLDSYKLVDVGRDVVDSGSTETFTKSLFSLIGKMYIDAREYEQDIPSIFVDSTDWGWFTERVKFEMSEIMDDPMYNLVAGTDYSKLEHTFFMPKVKAKIFEEGKAILTPQSFGEEQLKEAFLSWESMDRFMSGIRQYVKITIDNAMRAYAHMLVSAGVAVSVAGSKNAIHLLTEAKAMGISPADATPESALENPVSMRYFMQRIANVRGYFETMSTAWNNGSIPVFTPRKYNNLVLLNDFANASKFVARANTYNPDEIGIGDYDKITMWQGVQGADEKFDLATLSEIKISADANNKLGIGTEAFNQKYVVGLCYDRFALGLCPYKTKVTSSITAVGDFYNEFHHTLVNYILDADYSMVAFVLD